LNNPQPFSKVELSGFLNHCSLNNAAEDSTEGFENSTGNLRIFELIFGRGLAWILQGVPYLTIDK